MPTRKITFLRLVLYIPANLPGSPEGKPFYDPFTIWLVFTRRFAPFCLGLALGGKDFAVERLRQRLPHSFPTLLVGFWSVVSIDILAVVAVAVGCGWLFDPFGS